MGLRKLADERKGGLHFMKFLMLDQASLDRMMTKEGKLSGTDYKVLLALLRYMDAGNYVNRTQAFMTEYAGLPKQMFSLSLGRLVKKDLAVRIPAKEGRPASIMISPFVVFKGNGTEHAKAQNAYRKHAAKA